MKTTKEVLVAARALIEKPEKWIQRQMWSLQDDSVCCAFGALLNVSTPQERWGAETVLRRAMDGGIAIFNDSHTHSEVLEAFDRAIALAEQEG